MLASHSVVSLVGFRALKSRFSGCPRWLRPGVLALVVCPFGSVAPCAQGDLAWPTKPITTIVGFAAGGNTDLMARIATQRLSEHLRQTVVVDNRAGAGGTLAASYVARATPDGYTLMFAASPQIGVVPLLQRVKYDPVKDFVPISSFGSGPYVMAIRSSIPAKSVGEFVDHARRNPITFGSGGVGTIAHLTTSLFLSRLGLEGVHVPFRGSGLTATALVGGQIDMFFANASDIVSYANDGRVKLIAVAAEKRLKQLPDVPTFSESYP